MGIRTKFRERQLMRRAWPYPIHGRTLGYLGTPREPYTWFVCNNGHTEMGVPWATPDRSCVRCSLDMGGFTGWEAAEASRSYLATMDAIGPSDCRSELYRRTQSADA